MDKYDLIIIGGGPAGLTAGIYASRARLKTVILEKLFPGGHAASTSVIENYPGFAEGINGPDLMEIFTTQAQKFGCEVKTEEVVSIEAGENNLKIIKTSSAQYEAKAVIIASGSEPNLLGVEGEEKFKGRGISFCATCDAPLYKSKTAVVVGGGDSACEEALEIAKFADKVYLIHRRDTLRSVKILQERVSAQKKIEVILNSVVTAFNGEKRLESIKIKDVKISQEREIKADGVFLYIGYKPLTEFIKFDIQKDEVGTIVTDDYCRTSVPGVFAAGDIRSKMLRQIVTAAADGATAAFMADKYISEL
ncbi:MAG: thioredoxin-disulfide reductase [Planctomycetota bacterium]